MLLDFLPQRIRAAIPSGTGGTGTRRPSLLTVTAAAAGVAAIANAVAIAAPTPDTPTRLGTSIAQSMRERDRRQADRNRALDLREQAARAAEQRLRNDLQASQPAGGSAAPGTQPGATPPNPQDNVFDNLARIYQTMKPARAAAIIEKLALDVQVQVAKRMRERQTALIMAAMSPQAAVELSMALAGREVAKAPPPRPVAVAATRPAEPRKEAPRARRLRRKRGAAPAAQVAAKAESNPDEIAAR